LRQLSPAGQGRNRPTVELLDEALEPLLRDGNLDAYRRSTQEPVRSAEEALYHRMLCEGYARPEMVLRNVALWTDNRHSRQKSRVDERYGLADHSLDVTGHRHRH